MNSQAQDLFLRALELPESERDTFLAEACGDDGELHLEVQRMLVDSARADSLFGEGDTLQAMAGRRLAAARESGELDATIPAEAAAVIDSLRSEEEGEMIGSYKLLQEIGVGGFGSVWMAEQSKPISRKVALKLIKMGMDTKEVIARFEQERQALAMMDHPNIARVFDAGATDRGRPYFVMELVKGIPITDYCDQVGLGTKERLALFGDVCAAINHAHQKGIIHRDIKPSNVMVTLHGDKPVVKVIDFGIAKATQGKLTDQTLFTRFEQFIGTPVYMSPEQASLSGLDIDTRSDIYALGILLYEMLVGKPPFDAKSLVSAGYEEMRRIIREVEPVKPSSRLGTIVGEERTLLARARRMDEAKLNRLVEPDLDWIVMKAIDKDRTRRYETANAFAQDIMAFLADEPVTATPPSAGYQFKKFAKRNKAALRVAAAIAAVLVSATVVSTWQAVRATKAEARADQETERTRAALADAEAISTFMTFMFTSSQPGQKNGGRELKVVDVLKSAVVTLESNPSFPPARRAMLQGALGNTYHALGLYPQAVALQEKVRDYCLKTHGPEHPETLVAMNNLAYSYSIAGRKDEALKLQEEVLALIRKLHGKEDPKTIWAMHNLAISYSDVGRLDEALKLQEKALALFCKMSGPGHPDTLLAMNNLANSYSDAGRKDEALKMREQVLALLRKVGSPEHPDTLLAMNNLANSYSDAGRRDEALKLREKVLALRRKVLGPEHPDTLAAMDNLANSYSVARLKDKALKLQEEELALRRKVSGPEHPDTLLALHNLAGSYFGAGRRDDALKLREAVLALRRKVLGSEHPDTLSAMGDLAISYADAGRKDEALKIFEEVLALRRKVLGTEHLDTLSAMHNLAVFYQGVGRKDEVLRILEELLALRRKVLGPEQPETLGTMTNLARLYREGGKLTEAIELGKTLFDAYLKGSGESNAETLNAMTELAISYQTADRIDDAMGLEERALALKRKNLPKADPMTIESMENLATCYEKASRKDEAAKLRAELEALKAKQ